jgi:hypothetical protein
MNISGTVRLISLALLATVMVPASTSASSIVLSQVTLDWTGFTFSVDGGLVVDRIDYAVAPFSLSYAQTPIGGPQSAQGNVSTASSSSTQMGGAALASSSTNNGFLQSGSQSSTFGESPTGHLKANGDASAFVDFWLYGHGSGNLTVSVPYTLQIQVNANQAPPGSFRDDFVSSNASASLMLGPGAGFAGEQWFDSADLTWLPTAPVVDGVLRKTGTLTVSRSLVEPTFGPLIFLGATVRSDAVAAVPEPGELELLWCGLVGLVGSLLRRGRSKH